MGFSVGPRIFVCRLGLLLALVIGKVSAVYCGANYTTTALQLVRFRIDFEIFPPARASGNLGLSFFPQSYFLTHAQVFLP